ncbi:MAG TPA: sugar transferase, partial [archaeon]|nr:sugar transferase [archaeon]
MGVKKSEAIFGAIRVPLDALAVLAALLLAYRLREANIDLVPSVQLLEPASTLPPLPYYLQKFVLPSIVAFVLFSASLGLYVLQMTRGAWNEVGRIFTAALLWLVGIMAWYFLVQKQLFYSRVLLLHSTAFIALFVSAMRMVLILLQRRLLLSGIGVRAVVSVGRQAIAKSAAETLERDIRYAYLGHVPDLEVLRSLEKRRALDLVLQTDPNPGSSETLLLIDYCRAHHIGYAFLPPVFADVPHQLAVERLGLLPMIRFQPTPLDGWGRIFKRLFDVVASVLFLVVLSPLFLLLSLCILLDSGWPVFYVSRRIGEAGQGSIPVLKFRSMVQDA